ncbi:Pre-mRNA-processing factor 19 [Balamuthia mandrillaris]
MQCALSGTEPEEPVVSRVSGHVFEKRLIEKYLENATTCPITKQPLSTDDLIPLQGFNKIVKPRPAKATSIPSLINLFQNEWDAVMLECYTLKQQLDMARQELAHALYQQDAACRVIARLTRERDEARRALASAKGQMVPTEQPSQQPQRSAREESMELESGITEALKQRLISFSKQLTAERKQRKIPEDTATPNDIKTYREISSHPPHSASKPGILCLDLHPTQPLVVTGGVDTKGVIFDRDSQKVVGTLTGHSKKVSDVLFHPQNELVFTASYDNTVRVWSPPDSGNKYKSQHIIKVHKQPVVGVSLHPTKEYLASGSRDASWAFLNIDTGACLTHVTPEHNEAIHCHPDGLILGTGTAGSQVRIWDMKSVSNVASFTGHKATVNSISFSENGFFMASAADDNTIKMWDLRKLKKGALQTISLDDPASSVSFDYSGQHLAVAGADLRVYSIEGEATLVETLVLSDFGAPVTDAQFGPNASFLAATSMDRTLRFFAQA